MFEQVMNLLERGVVALEKIAAVLASDMAKTGMAALESLKAQEEAAIREAGKSPEPGYLIPEEVVHGPAETTHTQADVDNALAAAQANSDTLALRREFLKKALTEKGIKFKPSTRTETLEKLYADANNGNGGQEKPAGASIEDQMSPPPTTELKPPSPPADAPDWQKEMARRLFNIKHRYTIKAPLEVPGSPATKDEARDALVKCSATRGKDMAMDILRTVGGAEKLGEVPEILFAGIVLACNEAAKEAGNGSK
jgi:hypothetical protein